MSQDYMEISPDLAIGVVGVDGARRNVMTGMLKDLGYRNFRLYDKGIELVNQLRREGLDLVFILGDVWDMRWINVLRVIRTDERVFYTPAVVIRDGRMPLADEEQNVLSGYEVVDVVNPDLTIREVPPLVNQAVQDSRNMKSVQYRLGVARNLYKQGMLAKARKIYERLVEESSGSITARTGMMQTSRATPEKQMEQLTWLLEKDPGNYNFKFELMEYYISRNDLTRFRRVFLEASEEMEKDAEFYWLGELGEVCLSLKLPDFCYTIAETLIDAAPEGEKWRPWLYKARTMLVAGDVHEAKKYVERADAASDGRVAEVINIQAVIKRREGLHDEATEIFKKALEFSPEDHRIAFNIALCQIQKQDKETAIEYLRKSLEICPNYTRAKDLLNRLMAG